MAQQQIDCSLVRHTDAGADTNAGPENNLAAAARGLPEEAGDLISQALSSSRSPVRRRHELARTKAAPSVISLAPILLVINLINLLEAKRRPSKRMGSSSAPAASVLVPAGGTIVMVLPPAGYLLLPNVVTRTSGQCAALVQKLVYAAPAHYQWERARDRARGALSPRLYSVAHDFPFGRLPIQPPAWLNYA